VGSTVEFGCLSRKTVAGAVMGRSPNAAKRMDARELPARTNIPVGSKLPGRDTPSTSPTPQRTLSFRATKSGYFQPRIYFQHLFLSWQPLRPIALTREEIPRRRTSLKIIT